MKSEEYDFQQSKEEYRKFCREDGNKLPIFMQDWYLDATVADGAEWRVICIKENQKIVAVFPFQYEKIRTRFGIQLYKIRNTFQMVHGGIWIDDSVCNTTGKREKYLIEKVNQVIEQLPYYDSLVTKFDLPFMDWTPLYWKGFKQTTYYTYIMDPQNYDRDEEKLFRSFRADRKRNIKKAEQLYTVDRSLTGEDFYNLLDSTYIEKEKQISYSYGQFRNLDKAISEHDAGIVYGARDKKGVVVAASYIFCEEKRRYNMFVAFKQGVRGALELTTWYGMRDCLRNDIIFDFEGSMIPGVSEYNRGFYVEKKPYYVISDCSNKMKVVEGFQLIREGIKKRGTRT